jgi:hypothetical protein
METIMPEILPATASDKRNRLKKFHTAIGALVRGE